MKNMFGFVTHRNIYIHMSENKINKNIAMPCKNCGRIVENVGDLAKTVECSVCFMSRVPWPDDVQPKSSGRPPGWHFMAEFVDKDGTVYHKGVEQPHLKGTLKPTKVSKKKIKRRSKREIEAAKIKKYRQAKARA